MKKRGWVSDLRAQRVRQPHLLVVSGFGFWVLGFEFWVFDFGFLILGLGF